MKKLVFISTLILLAFSCKKERLNGSKEIMVGKWEKAYNFSYYFDYKRKKYYNYSDTLIPGVNSNSVFITIKKSGKVLVENDGVESKYKMNFKKKYDSDASFDNETSEVKIRTEDGLQHLGYFYSFWANFHHQGDKEVNSIQGAVNDDNLYLRTGGGLFSEIERNRIYISQTIFKRVE